MVLIGLLEAPAIDLDAIDAKLARGDYAPVRVSLTDVQMTGTDELFTTYAGDGAALAPWLRGTAINRDKDLRPQYLAGLAFNRAEEDSIYRELRQYWTLPVKLFTGSPARLDRFFNALREPPKTAASVVE